MLSAAPGAEDIRTVHQLALAAVRQGHEVHVFLNADGVLSGAALADLAEEGAYVAGCKVALRARGASGAAGVKWGSQLDWAQAVREADRVIAFG